MTIRVIEANNIQKKFKDQVIFDGVNFTVNKGEIVALLGANGAGKSTLIKILTQLIPKNGGTVHYFNQQKNVVIDREKISMMSQDTVKLQKIRVMELIQLARSFSRHPMAYDRLIAYADLKEQEHFFVEKLSGGQRRRLGFALSLANDPEVLFLDEPTAGMDSYSRLKFWQTITKLKAQGKTFIVTSHYLDEIEKIADRLVILVKGSFVFDGTLTELRHNRGSSEIRFYSDKPKEYWQSIEGITSVQIVNHKVQLMSEDVPTFLRAMATQFEELEQLAIQPNSLESLFETIQEENQR